MKLLLEISFRGLYYFLTDRDYRKFIFLVARFGGQKRHVPFATKINNFPWKGADALSFIWQFKEIFADKSYHFKPKSKHPVIYDCGTNIGLSCLYYALNYPDSRIEAFEPDPAIFTIAKTNLSQLSNCTIHLHEAAVWKSNGKLTFFQHDVDGGSLTSAGDANTVEVATIDLLEKLNQETHIDFLKMDIEGAEHAVLMHISPVLSKIESLFIEYHSYPNEAQHLSEILGLLEKNGFRYYLLTQNRRKQPMVNLGKNKSMDYQTNIYAYRN